jgi:hypothetical protein
LQQNLEVQGDSLLLMTQLLGIAEALSDEASHLAPFRVGLNFEGRPPLPAGSPVEPRL